MGFHNEITKQIIAFFSIDKNRGLLTSAGSFTIANGLNYVLYKEMGYDIKESTFWSIYVLGSIMGYVLDILFAKSTLRVHGYKGHKVYYGKIPITDINTRGRFLLRSLISKHFIRFIVISIIDTIIGLSMIKFMIQIMDRYNVLVNWEYRDLIIVIIVSSFTYNLYLNDLRFDWAYSYKDNFMLNILISVWFSLIILIVVSIEAKCSENKKETTLNKELNNKDKKNKDRLEYVHGFLSSNNATVSDF